MLHSEPDDETYTALVERANELTLKNRAMDESPIGITIADITRDDDPLVYANAGFERIAGYPREEVLGQNCRVLQGGGTDEEPVAAMRNAIGAGDSVQVELLNYRKEGTAFWNEVTLAPVSDAHGEIRYYVGFQQDVTQRKEYEFRIEDQRDDLALLNQLVRHDIRNDLQLVLGCAEVLQGHVDTAEIETVETILESAQHAVDLTDTAREMAEVMLKEETDGHIVSVPELLRSRIEETQSSHPNASIIVDGDLPAVDVRANRLLESVFDNLLQNAIQHNDKEHPEITVSLERNRERAVVRMADNGPGVPDEMKRKVFRRGEKGVESGGTGIGLYLVDTLIEEYGGEVWIEDNETEGAVFAIELPIVTRESAGS